MNEEIDHVSFQIARALLVRNFKYLCDNSYSIVGEFLPHKQSNNSNSSQKIACPSLYQVKDWLRKEQNIHIEISPFMIHNRPSWSYYIYVIDDIDITCIYESFANDDDDGFESYECALIDSITYTIEHVLDLPL